MLLSTITHFHTVHYMTNITCTPPHTMMYNTASNNHIHLFVVFSSSPIYFYLLPFTSFQVKFLEVRFIASARLTHSYATEGGKTCKV